MIETHVPSPIKEEHFTPFATLLFHLPPVVHTVFGSKATLLYEYHPRRGLEVSVWPNNGSLYRVDVCFDQTGYSFAEIKAKFSEAKIVLEDPTE